MFNEKVSGKLKPESTSAQAFDSQSKHAEVIDPVIDFKAELEKAVLTTQGIIYILPHAGIDFDCVGAAIGLMNSLKLKFPNKQIVVLIPDKKNDPINSQINLYTNIDGVEWADGQMSEKLVSAGMVIMVDSNNWSFTGVSPTHQDELAKSGTKLLILDHHGGNHINNSTAYIEPSAHSTSELIARMYLDDGMSQATALLLALGIVSDTGGLKHIYGEENIARVSSLFQRLSQLAGYDLAKLIEIVGEKLTTQAELALAEKLEKTKFILPIPGYPEDVVKVFFDLDLGGVSTEVDLGKVTDVILNHHLEHQTNYTNLRTQNDQLLEPPADFSIFIKPVKVTEKNLVKLLAKGYQGKAGDLIWEIKMRTNSILIVRQIGEKLHRGGKPGSGKAEVWLTPSIQKAIDEGQFSMESMLTLVCKFFAKVYAETKAEELQSSTPV